MYFPTSLWGGGSSSGGGGTVSSTDILQGRKMDATEVEATPESHRAHGRVRVERQAHLVPNVTVSGKHDCIC